MFATQVVAGCGAASSSAEEPVATLGSPNAEREFRALMRRWTLGTPEERQELDVRLRSFVNRFGEDPLVRMATVLLAWNALERGELKKARMLSQEALLGPTGVPRDLATLVAGAVERRLGNPENALLRLAPLLNKMLDEFATELLNEELVQAALGARRWVDAIRYMEVWQRQSEPGRERQLRDRLRELLANVPKAALLEALERHERAGTLTTGAESAQLIVQQLAVLVVGDHDSALARELLDRFGPLLGSYGESVARLAADTTRGQVRAQTVGALLAFRTAALRRRSAEVSAGMAFGLELPGSSARLLTRDGGVGSASVSRAMAQLAAAGAAVIVAAIDPDHAGAVVTFANDNSLPVVLLSPDPDDNRGGSPFVFFAGEDPRQSVSTLSRALVAGGASVVAGFGAPLRSGGSGEGLGVGFERSCESLPEAAELRAERVDALLVYDGATCGNAVATLADQLRAPLGLGLGVRLRTTRRGARVLSAGVFPVDEASPDPRLSTWIGEGRGVPSWWHGLGRDAAVLAWRAVQDLAASGSENEDEVKARRVEATSALAAAEVELWTTQARGFGGDQKLDRDLTVREGVRFGR